ncbi:AraC family transcriptional regulator ligand-binding domain-containing protein [Novosphingobium sp. ZN18A2]|uniref:AraC family transcriptional regulator n=1 Tax=Novosphingobium sp. ZN18A2 TaxID=3079861 RepID=UPI0030D0AB37
MVPVGNFKRAGGFAGLTELIAEKGGDVAAILARFGIGPADLSNSEAYLPYSPVIHLLDYCSETLGVPHFGLELGSRQSIEAIGPLAPLLLASSTVKEGLELVARYMMAHAPGARMELIEDADSGRLSYMVVERSATYSRNGNEFNMAAAYGVMKTIIGPALRLSGVSIAADALSGSTSIPERHFGAPVKYGQVTSYLEMPSHFLQRKVDSGNPLLLKLAQAQCEELCPSGADDVEAIVSMQVRKLLPFGECSLETISRQLCIHPRSLQNRLAEKGLVFRNILRAQRQALAETYLGRTETPIAEVAILLGYSDQATFTRAFADWTGLSPKRFRTAARNGGHDVPPKTAAMSLEPARQAG